MEGVVDGEGAPSYIAAIHSKIAFGDGEAGGWVVAGMAHRIELSMAAITVRSALRKDEAGPASAGVSEAIGELRAAERIVTP